jgi:hypothetical protein
MNSISIMISIMPDLRSLSHTLIREHPEGLESTGFRLEFIPIKIGAGKTILTGGGPMVKKINAFVLIFLWLEECVNKNRSEHSIWE